jgi:tetratricopeptide (TPR) repeat protein
MFEDENEDDFFNLLELVDDFKRDQAQGKSTFYDLEEFEAIADYFYELGKIKQALEVVEIATSQHPYATHLWFKKVQYLTASDNTQEAKNALKELELVLPESYELFMARAGLFSKIGNHQKAIQQYRQALNLAEYPEDVYHLLALEYQLTGAYEKALKYLKQSLEIYPDDEIAIYNIALCYDLLDQQESGRDFFLKLVDENPYGEVAWYHLGIIYAKIKEYNLAIRALDYAILIDDFFSAAYYEKARILELLFRFKEAADTYKDTFEFDGTSGYAYYKMGICYLQLHKEKKAESHFYKAIKEDPELEEAYYELALMKDESKEWDEAVFLIKKAVELDFENWKYQQVSALIHHRAGKLDEARLIYAELIKSGYFESDTFIQFSELLNDLCEFEEALEALADGIKKLPSAASLYFHLAGFFFIQGRDAEGIVQLKDALEIFPEGKIFFLDVFPILIDHRLVNEILNNLPKRS